MTRTRKFVFVSVAFLVVLLIVLVTLWRSPANPAVSVPATSQPTPTAQEQRISLHLVRSETPGGMNGPTVYIFRVEGIDELKGKGAQVTVTPRGQGVVNEVENVVLAFVQSDWPSGTYRVVLRVGGQQAEATIEYKERQALQPAPSSPPTPAETSAPTPTRAPVPTSQPEPSPTATPRSVPAPTPVPTPQQTLAPVCDRPSAICGRVTTTAGQPLAGVYIEAYQISVDQKYGTCTDVSGSYLIPVEPYPTYRVKFVVEAAPGKLCKSASIRSPAGDITRWWQNTIDPSTVTFVSVSNAGVSGIDMAFPPIVTVSGRVTEKVTGAGIPGVYVALWPRLKGSSSSTPYSGAGTTDANGAYFLAGFAGEQRLYFRRGGINGSQQWNTGQDWSGGCFRDAADLLIPSAGLSNFNVALPPLVAVSGRVNDWTSGVAFSGVVLVIAHDASGCPLASGQTSTGDYRIFLSVGIYRLEFIQAGGQVPAKWFRNGSSFATADPIVIERDTGGIDLSPSNP